MNNVVLWFVEFPLKSDWQILRTDLTSLTCKPLNLHKVLYVLMWCGGHQQIMSMGDKGLIKCKYKGEFYTVKSNILPTNMW